ncbi:MAG: Rid family detoxifying hydrolase [Fidelibacterota bacterium]
MAKKIVYTPDAPEPLGIYSQAVVCNGLVFSAGQIAVDPKTGNLIEDNFENQVIRILENIKIILEEAGSTLDNILKFTVFIKDLKNFPVVNDVFGRYFKTDPPARSVVQISRLPKDASIEIECIAAIK